MPDDQNLKIKLKKEKLCNTLCYQLGHAGLPGQHWAGVIHTLKRLAQCTVSQSLISACSLVANSGQWDKRKGDYENLKLN